MIHQQLEAWKNYYRSNAYLIISENQLLNDEMKEIESETNVVIPDNFLESLSIEFSDYQDGHGIGSHLQQLIDYPAIVRYNKMKNIINKNRYKLHRTKKPIEKYNQKIIHHQERIKNHPHNLCEADSPHGSPTLRMDTNNAKIKYTKSFEYLGETEKYCWYIDEMKETLSISFSVHVECKCCHDFFDINIWKHYPLITDDTDVKTAAIYEIGADTSFDHNFHDEFFYKLLNRKQALFKFWKVLHEQYRIISIDNC